MKKQYKANGGNMNDLGQVLSTIAPLAALIPGAGAVVSPALGIAGGLMQQQQGPTTPKLAGSKYAKGGKIDTQLNSTAFKVNGNPSVKDSEYYPTMGVHLDHDEVIDTQNNFAFSNRITNPYTNNTFAKDASRFHKAIGKSEKRAAFSSGDSFSEKTIEHSKKQTDKLAGLQEIVASVQGLRSEATSYATGGPIDPLLQVAPMQRSTTTVDSIKDLSRVYSPLTAIDDNFSNRMFNMPTSHSLPQTPQNGMPGFIAPPTTIREGVSGHSKSKERFREKAYGGNLPSYADGGPFDPLPGQQFIEIYSGPNGVKQYYDPYNNRQVFRKPSTGTYFAARDNYAVPSQDIIKAHLQQYPGGNSTPVTNEGTSAYIPQTGTPYPYDINPLNPTAPRDTPQPWTLDPTGGMGGITPRTATPVTPTVPPRGTKRPTTGKKPVLPVLDRSGVKPPVMDDTFPDMNNLGLGEGYKSKPRGYTPETEVSETDYGSVSFNNLPQYGTPPGMGSLNGKLTAGDYMQLATVGSRIYDAFRKPEVELPNLDETALTKQAYDPATQLAQSSRNYSTTLNSLSTNSPNLRRAMANQAYASKLGQDADVIEKYDQMNKQSQTQYEDRLSNRRRFNTSKIDMTNDLNARNRGAAMNARTAAFDTVGNTGQALNQRKSAYDTLALQAQLYPDVYQRFIQEYILNGQ